MSETTGKQQRWNQRYQDKTFSEKPATYVLFSNRHFLKNKGVALDLACGLGVNALFLAKTGYQVTAIDYSETALIKLSDYAREHDISIETQCADLEITELKDSFYDVVVVSYYLQRSLFPEIFKSLKPGGLLFYQTFSGVCVDGNGPENPAYRLQQGELLSLCAEHSILYYREDGGCCIGQDCFNGEAMIVVKRE